MIFDLVLLATLLSPIVGSENANVYSNFMDEKYVNLYCNYNNDIQSNNQDEIIISPMLDASTDEQTANEIVNSVLQSGTRSLGNYNVSIDEIIAILGFTPGEIVLALQATEKANNMTNTLYPDTTNYQDDGDAFRHTYWSALLTRSIGAEKAKQLTDAHEANTNDPLDRSMDLHNNANGQLLYSEWVEKFHYSGLDAQNNIAYFIHHCIANGEIYDCVKFSSDGDKLVYTTIGTADIASFGMKGYIDSIAPEDYEYEEKYFFYEKTKNIVTSNNATISTVRRRTGFIQQQYIVLSPRREGAGYAYLEYNFSTPVLAIDLDITLWSQFEYLDPQNCYAYIWEKGNDYDYDASYDLLNDYSLSVDRNNPDRMRFNFCEETTSIKFTVQSPAIGDRNKGRICIGDMDIIFANTNY